MNMSIQQLVAVQKQDEFTRAEFLGYIGMLKRNKNFTKQWKAQNPEEITKFQDYETIFKEFRGKLGSSVSISLALLYCILLYSRTSLQRPRWEQTKMAVVAGSGRTEKLECNIFRGYNSYIFLKS